MPISTLHLGIFYMPQSYDMGPTALLPLRRKTRWRFFCPKNPTASAGCEPANLGTKGQHATSRPPKPRLSQLLLPAAGSSDGLTNTRCCRYSCMRSWWWVEVPPETCRAVSRWNKLCNVVSCWIHIRKITKDNYFPSVQNLLFACLLLLWVDNRNFLHILYFFLT
jgi:hypothetical protein